MKIASAVTILQENNNAFAQNINGSITLKSTDENANVQCEPNNVIKKRYNNAFPVKDSFKPFGTLCKFIDSIPERIVGRNSGVPELLEYTDDRQMIADEIAKASSKQFPSCFPQLPLFLWEDEVIIHRRLNREICIGSGRFGRIVLGSLKDGSLVALKYFKDTEDHPKSDILSPIICEAGIQNILAKQNVAPKFIGFGIISGNTNYHRLVIISEFIEAKFGSLRSLTLSAMCFEDTARRRGGYPCLLSSKQYGDLFERLNDKFRIMAECGVIHTDIKKDNIILRLSKDGLVLDPFLIDFGSSVYKGVTGPPQYNFDTPAKAREFLCRYEQVAPEIAFHPDKISYKSDIYAVGLITKSIGQMLELPALLKLATFMRLWNAEGRPNYHHIRYAIEVAFGKRGKFNPIEVSKGRKLAWMETTRPLKKM